MSKLPEALPPRGVPLPAGILRISRIAGIQDRFANTLIVEMGPDNAGRIREAG